MAYDFLNTTTIDPQLQQQEQLGNMVASQAAAQDPNNINPNDLQEIQDQDLSNLEEQGNDYQEVSEEDTNKMATDTHDFENDQPDEIDYQLMSYIMGDGESSQQPSRTAPPSKQYGGGTFNNASTVYSDSTSWLKNRVNNIKYQPLNQNRSKYQMPMGSAIMEAKKGGAYSTNYQYGGKTLFADDEATLRQGLNNNNYQRAVLKLQGANTIRGLDNHQPVAVTDGSKYKVLHGPQDTAKFNGNVYENRL